MNQMTAIEPNGGTAVTADAQKIFEPSRQWRGGIAAAAAWLATAVVIAGWPDLTPWSRTRLFAMIALAAAIAVLILGVFGGRSERLQRVRRLGPWFVALAAIVAVWEILTAKTGVLPLPFFPPPQSILEVYTDDSGRLVESIYRSLLLLVPGYLIGAAAGFSTGVAVGWSRSVSYWAHPVLRFLGPLPATAWLPIAFFVFPGTASASTFLIALSTAFPVAVLTASGIGSVGSAFYDVARTLGASKSFLVTKVAIPAALPHVFVGLFMGLSASFAVLIVAEMMGVKAGLGWYLQWAQGWAAYANLYAALIIMALLFSGLISLLFFARDSVLAWQKGIVRW
ncbi:MAG: ABC transporter permease [Janthinobacterium lividum]